MSATIINAAPMVLLRGTQDRSTRPLIRVAEEIPQHLPKTYFYAKKGPTTEVLASGDSRTQIYGADSFDPRMKWCNHSTVLSNLMNAEGNAQMYKRIRPLDAGPEANILISLDVLPTLIPLYQRNTDGSFKVDVQGNKIPVTGATTAPGYKVKFVVTHHTGNEVPAEPGYFGNATVGPGDQLDAVTALQSQRYPIFQVKAASFGSDGNNAGLRLYAPTSNSANGFNRQVLTTKKVYPYRLSVIRRLDEISTPRIVDTQFGEQFINFTFKKNVIDPVSNSEYALEKRFPSSYENVSDTRFPAVFGDFGSAAIYDQNIETLIDMFYLAEKANPHTSNDFSAATTGEQHLFNFIGGQSSNGAPYNTYQIITGGTGTTRLTEFANIMANGGSDGTMNDTLFATLVAEEMARYGDENDELMDTATHVESTFYDSGYPMATKYALLNAIAVRKDTFVNLGTHTVGEPALSASEENSVAISLRTHAQLFPESDLYGTPVMRAMIMGRSGKLRNSLYTERVPATFEIGIKSARYMGAGDGRWKSGFAFDGAPGSILDFMTDINVTYTPASVRNKDWDAGLNWVQKYDRQSLFIPALKTVYSDDTSVLNSYLTAMAICQINKVAQTVWRDLSGNSRLSNGQIAARANELVNERLLNRFDGRYIIKPAAFFTDADIARGYSYTLPISIYAPNMTTVMTTNVAAFRISDLDL